MTSSSSGPAPAAAPPPRRSACAAPAPVDDDRGDDVGDEVAGGRATHVLLALEDDALAFAAGIFLILELDTPFHGLIRLSSEPLVKTLELLGR